MRRSGEGWTEATRRRREKGWWREGGEQRIRESLCVFVYERRDESGGWKSRGDRWPFQTMRNSGDKGNASENLRGGGGEGDRERGREGKKGSWGGGRERRREEAKLLFWDGNGGRDVMNGWGGRARERTGEGRGGEKEKGKVGRVGITRVSQMRNRSSNDL